MTQDMINKNESMMSQKSIGFIDYSLKAHDVIPERHSIENLPENVTFHYLFSDLCVFSGNQSVYYIQSGSNKVEVISMN